jgi:hypothetical protein
LLDDLASVLTAAVGGLEGALGLAGTGERHWRAEVGIVALISITWTLIHCMDEPHARR